ncbi:OmpA family protein [Chitinophaga sp. CF118]|uniref:OmpA family protein n=1 Tax=Chitinophaga sp. CF118 TaxID=1884367 RepID=UPI000B7EA3A5|nr:OmpA family protein [Chitinophaga sp. CF118]
MRKPSMFHTIFLLALFIPFHSMAQTAGNGRIFTDGPGYRRWSIGINGGVLAPIAPTGGSNDFTKWKVSEGYGGYIKWQLFHALGIRADYLGGKLAGNNDWKLGNGSIANRKYNSFETRLKWAASLSAVVNVATINWLYRKNFVQIYVSAGGGLAGYSPQITSRTGITKYKLGDKKKNIQEFFVPIGTGLKFKLSQVVNLDLGYTMHFVDGDNLDGFNYGPNKDKFSYGYAGLEFSLGKRSKPQLAWQNPAKVMYDELEAQRTKLTQNLETMNATNTRLTADVDKLLKDTDGDGVSDYFDKCLDTAPGAKVDGSGCELPKITIPAPIQQITQVITEDDRRLVREAIHNLEFEFGKASIKPSSYPSLNRVAKLLSTKGFSLKLGGHTDNVGKAERNMILSKDRAESVKQYLSDQGANPSKIEAVGYGAGQPINSNKTAAGRQKNRRVEFTLY